MATWFTTWFTTWIKLALAFLGAIALAACIVLGFSAIPHAPDQPIEVTHVTESFEPRYYNFTGTQIIAIPGEKEIRATTGETVMVTDLAWTGATKIRMTGAPCKSDRPSDKAVGRWVLSGTTLSMAAGSQHATCSQSLNIKLNMPDGQIAYLSLNVEVIIREE